MESNAARRIARIATTAALAVACFAVAPSSAAAATYPPYPSKLIVKSEMRFKANLVQRNLKRSPQLVFFGGSRSQRFDPVFARQRLRLRSVNISQSNARPESAWGYLNWFYRRWPDANVRWVWGMQVGMLRDRDLDPALLQARRFYRYFPDDLLASQRQRLPDSVAEMPRAYGYMRNRYSSLGMLLWSTYDRRRAKGYTLTSRSTHTSRRCSASRARRWARTREPVSTSSRRSSC